MNAKQLRKHAKAFLADLSKFNNDKKIQGMIDAAIDLHKRDKEIETLRTKVAELEAQLDYYRSLEPVAYYDTQERGFYWAKPTKIEAPVTVKVAPIPLYAMEKE